jgi:hypothetical protein
MAVSEFQAKVATIALEVAASYGCALAGGNALLAHGIGNRPTEDVNLFTAQPGGVRAAAKAVEDAFRAAGFYLERVDRYHELDESWQEDLAAHWAEWTVARDGQQVMLQIGTIDHLRPPVATSLGPVMALEDVLASKVCALASRAEVRDYIDVAAVLDRYTPEQLIELAWQLDEGLTAGDFTDLARRLDHLDDDEFARYGLRPSDVAEVRNRFAAWPRSTPGKAQPGQ